MPELYLLWAAWHWARDVLLDIWIWFEMNQYIVGCAPLLVWQQVRLCCTGLGWEGLGSGRLIEMCLIIKVFGSAL